MISVIVAAALISYLLLRPRVLEEKLIGGKYNAKVVIMGLDDRGFIGGEIVYTKDGIEHRGFYSSFLNNSLIWIKANTPEDCVFLNWWDYGHMIVGYAERETIIRNPSKEALNSVSAPDKITEFDSHEKLVDVANALTTTDLNLTKSIMKRYGATYILITTEDGGTKVPWLYQFAGLNYTQYVKPSSLTFNPQDYTDLGKQTMIYKLSNSTNIEGFTQVYSYEDVKIFKI
jgi:asparagine N-glycosylation enzyme membrane subunit Stt3